MANPDVLQPQAQKLIERRRRFNLRFVGVLAALVVAVGGYAAVQLSHAASNQLYLTPASGSLTAGQTVELMVRAAAGSEAVNAVQANLTYDPAKLQYVSMSAAGSAFGLEAAVSGGDGQVAIARGINGGATPVTGDVLVETVTFKVLANSGQAAVKFGPGSVLLRSSNSTNIVTSTGTGSYALGR